MPGCYIRRVIRRADSERLRKGSSGERAGSVPRGVRPGGLGLLHTLALLMWGVLILGASVALATETGFWWLVLIFGAAVPGVPLARATRGARAHPAPPAAPSEERERELLAVLGRHGEVGPVLVATETTLTVAEADEMLGEMARKGYLEIRGRAGVLAYASPGRGAGGSPRRNVPDSPASDGAAGRASTRSRDSGTSDRTPHRTRVGGAGSPGLRPDQP